MENIVGVNLTEIFIGHAYCDHYGKHGGFIIKLIADFKKNRGTEFLFFIEKK
jgi:hypothetical protein